MTFMMACNQKASPVIETNGSEINLAVGQKATYSGIIITVTSINDSRCPMDVQCIRAGEAIVILSLLDRGNTTQISLCTGSDCARRDLSAQNIVTVGSDKYEIYLQDVLPNPTKTLDTGTKKAVFTVRKTS